MILLKQIYKSSGLDVGSVLVISFKYGGTDSKLEQPVSKRSVQSTDNSSSLIVYHWVYLKQRTTLETDALEDRVKKAVESQPGISVDMDSISVLSLANMTSDQALTVLTQYGFFKQGIQNLNMDVLAKLGIIKGPGDFGLQSENSLSFCPAFQNVSYMSVMPATCLSSSDIYHGMVCSFRCDNDSYMTGSAHRVCLSSGIWSGVETACKKKCPHVLLPTNGELIPYTCKAVDSLVGQMCFLHCPLNYKVFDYTTESQNSGRSVFWKCMEEGHWSRSTGICEASCPSINIGSNQQFTSDTCLGSKSGDICYIQCAMGFVLEDGSYSQQVTCGYDGNWNKIPLPCKKTCSNIVPTSNETVTPSLCQENPYHGIQCMFECTPGFALVGSEVILCNASGVWSDSVPSCRRTCSALEPVQNGMIITIQGSCLVDQPVENSTCELKCDTGFTALSSITKCDNETGEWSVSNQTCLRTCSPLNVPEHGSWNPASCSEEGHHASFNECTLLCDAPYERQGNYTLACDEMTGLWDKQGGLCKARCGSVSAPNNGMILPNSESSCTSNPFAGTKCMFSCDIGFLLRGEHSLMCQADGSWSSVIPSCEERQQFLITQSLDGRMSCLTVSEEEIFKEMHNCSEHIESNRWVLNGTTNIQNAASQLCLSTSSNSNTPTV
ncbi:unnamed protein product [Clavelina lepadiformis]|uniref:Sushi domain-containing protein n=1 Tax=Clavelina lepadiformis TaxID=159417 RepID=A0ABP0G0X5_CLALP